MLRGCPPRHIGPGEIVQLTLVLLHLLGVDALSSKEQRTPAAAAKIGSLRGAALFEGKSEGRGPGKSDGSEMLVRRLKFVGEARCPDGYVDKTQGNSYWWDCAAHKRCPGIGYTDENCQCACVWDGNFVRTDPTTATTTESTTTVNYADMLDQMTGFGQRARTTPSPASNENGDATPNVNSQGAPTSSSAQGGAASYVAPTSSESGTQANREWQVIEAQGGRAAENGKKDSDAQVMEPWIFALLFSIGAAIIGIGCSVKMCCCQFNKVLPELEVEVKPPVVLIVHVQDKGGMQTSRGRDWISTNVAMKGLPPSPPYPQFAQSPAPPSSGRSERTVSTRPGSKKQSTLSVSSTAPGSSTASETGVTPSVVSNCGDRQHSEGVDP